MDFRHDINAAGMLTLDLLFTSGINLNVDQPRSGLTLCSSTDLILDR
jgi:hypothetical protein